MISTRTPEGEPNRCPVCGHGVLVEPSRPPGDAPCPRCGTLLWFPLEPTAGVVTAWAYGVGLIERGEVGAGLAMLQAVVAHQPHDVQRRRSLREIERTVRKEFPLAEEPASLVLTDVRLDIRQAKHKRANQFIEWEEIDRAAERGLAANPWNADLHVELGQACQARGYKEVALFAYRCALELAPDRTDVREAIAGLAGP